MNRKIRPRILIHAGMGKTGTTSIQRTMAASQDVLNRLGISYPLIDGKPSHNWLTPAFLPDSPSRNIRNKYSEQEINDIAPRYAHTLFESCLRSQFAIISGETLFRLRETGISALRKKLDSFGIEYDPLVLIYVREPASHYLAHVQQWIKGSDLFPLPREWYYDSLERIEEWSQAFRVVVRPFAREQLKGGDVIDDFLDVAANFFGVPINADAFSRKQSNTSLTAEGMIVCQNYQKKFHPGRNFQDRDARRLIDLLQKRSDTIIQTRPRLKESAARIVRERHAEMLQGLYDKYGISFYSKDDEHASDERDVTEYQDLADILDSYDEEAARELLWYVLYDALNADWKGAGKKKRSQGTSVPA